MRNCLGCTSIEEFAGILLDNWGESKVEDPKTRSVGMVVPWALRFEVNKLEGLLPQFHVKIQQSQLHTWVEVFGK